MAGEMAKELAFYVAEVDRLHAFSDDLGLKLEAAEAQVEALRKALEPFARASLSEWAGRGAVAPYIDRSHFETAETVLASLPLPRPPEEDGPA